MIREVRHDGRLFALILTHDHSRLGLQFFTPDDLTLQMGYMKYPAGHHIVPHIHKKVTRTVDYTLEAIVIKSGRVAVDLYTDDKKCFATEELGHGDAILFTAGGHGFRFLEEGEMIEIKQGPYVSQDIDKEKF